MKNEKKKDVLIGVLFAIIFILLAVLIALSISGKTKKNDPYDDKKSSTSTTTTAENDIDIAAIEKELNDYANKNKTNLEIKYALTRKYVLEHCNANTCEVYEDYYHNAKKIYSSFYSEVDVSQLDESIAEKDKNSENFYIKELKDVNTDEDYYLVGEIAEFAQEHYLYDKNYNKIHSFEMPAWEYVKNNDGKDILNNAGVIEIINNRVNYFLSSDSSGGCNKEKVELHEVYMDNGNLINNIKATYKAEDLNYSGTRCN